MLPVNQIQESLTEHKAIQEMLDTEKTYNESLARLLEIPAARMPDNELFAKLGVYLPQLKNVSDMLLLNVTMSLKDDVDSSSLNQLKIQRIQLLKAFFTLYREYASWYEIYVKETSGNPAEFDELSIYLSESYPGKLGLADYLIQPLQRGPRYNLLVTAAIDYNNKLANEDPAKLSEVSIADLVKAKELIKEYLLAANSSMSAASSSSSTAAKPYQFGDYTRAAFVLLGEYMENKESTEAKEGAKASKSSSRSAGIWCSIWPSKPKPQSEVTTSSTATLENEIDSEADEFVFM
ncbi:hypothetical protein A8135_12555 [Legionella jamestowniensis]|uniref:DH domain-containing protein n=1 Tax=Legionella jamestowniensis TaxID=455 RepID=A0ABX2Y2B6_9GAMM|nr:RhoGEF domain-containing protein [Legionella jamestowniensis]OCH98375.1 hypothetical protein A8135_12555 [Legionella jamestowniensis]